MRTPIAYALAWPHRIATPAPRLRLTEIGSLTFESPDESRFPALRVARHALQTGGSAPTIMNAANEVAVGSFLAGEIGFLHIIDVVEETLAALSARPLDSLEQLAETDAAARDYAFMRVTQCSARAVG
jgi:1-deoxy-D-xylulose-5-phosphate reductoisomerase